MVFFSCAATLSQQAVMTNDSPPLVRHEATAGSTVDAEDKPLSPSSTPRLLTPVKQPAKPKKQPATPKRHKDFGKLKDINFTKAVKRNYSRAAFSRCKNAAGCKSAKAYTHILWAATHQGFINELVDKARLLAASQNRTTLTRSMIEQAFRITMAGAPKRLYALD